MDGKYYIVGVLIRRPLIDIRHFATKITLPKIMQDLTQRKC